MKSNQKLTVLFWHRKSKADVNGYAPVICRISIDGDEQQFSISRKVHLTEWDQETKRAKGGADAKKTNQRIVQTLTDLERHFTILQLSHDYVTPLMLKNAYLGLPLNHRHGQKKEVRPQNLSLVQLADTFIADFTRKVEKGLRSSQTLRQWKATRNKIAEFVRCQYGTTDISVCQIDYSFATKFYVYLTVERNQLLKEAAAKKQLKNIKQLLSLAESNNYIHKNPIQNFKCGGDETDVAPLEFHDVLSIWQKEITIQRLIEVRDVFIFQCFTGFAYQDVYNLELVNLVKVGRDAERWLIKDRGKTGVSEMVPVMPIVEHIVEKYSTHPCRMLKNKLLPVNSNCRYNAYLKEIAILCGIERDLNTHLARHTFADLMLNEFEFPLEEVSKMLGHKTIRTTQRYAKVKKKRISRTWSKVKNLIFDEEGQFKYVHSL